MTTDFPTAADMRAKLDATLTAEARGQLDRLKGQMETAVAQGKSSITVFVFAHGVEDRLKQAGYYVQRHAPTYHDPREPNGGGGPYWTVSW